MSIVRTITTPYLKATYARTEAAEGHSMSRRGAIGIAFTPQRRAVRRMRTSRALEQGFPPATLFLLQSDDVIWEL